MGLIEWSSTMSVEIESIDEQHKKLFRYMNELYDALNQKKEKEVLIKLFENLDDYTHTHFSLEEKYFDKFDYKEKENHILQHKSFINQLAQMKRQIPLDLMDAEDLLTFLVNWLTGHIKKIDHKYIDCFHEHGLH